MVVTRINLSIYKTKERRNIMCTVCDSYRNIQWIKKKRLQKNPPKKIIKIAKKIHKSTTITKISIFVSPCALMSFCERISKTEGNHCTSNTPTNFQGCWHTVTVNKQAIGLIDNKSNTTHTHTHARFESIFHFIEKIKRSVLFWNTYLSVYFIRWVWIANDMTYTWIHSLEMTFRLNSQ